MNNCQKDNGVWYPVTVYYEKECYVKRPDDHLRARRRSLAMNIKIRDSILDTV